MVIKILVNLCNVDTCYESIYVRVRPQSPVDIKILTEVEV